MATTEEKLIKQATVSPHWLPQVDNFWYQRHGKCGESEFIFVDISKKIHRPAFDHEQVAGELKKKTGLDVDPKNLPFSRVEVQPDASYVCFRFNEKTWQYGPEGVLRERDDDEVDEENDQRLLREEVPSSRSSRQVSVKFVNRSNGAVLLFWIDWDCRPVFYRKLAIGAAERQNTYEGHVWRIVDEASGETVRIYSTPNQDSDVFVIEAKKAKPKKVTSVDDDAENANSIPDVNHKPKRQIFIAENELWLKEPDGSKYQLSSDGTEGKEYKESNIFPSPSEQFVMAWQFTPAQDHLVNLVEVSPEDRIEPRLQSIQYLKPGDRVKQGKPRLFDLDKKCEVIVDDSLFNNPYYLESIGWSDNGEEYRFIYNERGHKHVRVLSIHRDGRVRVVVEESSETFIDYSSKLYCWVIEDKDEMIWASERDGYNHLYLIDLSDGTVKAQITQGQWNVRSVDDVDESRRRIWLKVLGVVPNQDPYYAYPAYVNFDGTGFQVLAEDDGNHSWSSSPDKRYLVDMCSRVDLPPQTHLRDGETGEGIMLLEGITLESLEEEVVWNAPERFVAPGRDGKTQIYGIIIRPSNFDETKSYPILEDIYAGPQDFFTPKGFSSLADQREWANEGYIVVKLDGMGTNWRSKSFHDVCYKNLKDGGLPDRIAWIKAAASTRPWMDLSRVGIFGGSAGGQNAAAAVLHHGDFYKAAAADCGCHDNRMDKLWWNEQWMGYPVDEAYAESSNVTHAAKLNAALMLIVGGLDNNVDPSSTMQFVQALNEADKDYEFLFMPGEEHGCGGTEYGLRRQRAFFRRHLCPT
ncbi:Alpha/Beta hydrolase protein [Mariannaea sp. PMI_226]|nr:Alpha/Beta hydrolase protein [Mariannaea sp. PMI_226]